MGGCAGIVSMCNKGPEDLAEFTIDNLKKTVSHILEI